MRYTIMCLLLGMAAGIAVAAAVLSGVHNYWVITLTVLACVSASNRTLVFVQRRILRSRAVLMSVVGESLYQKAEAVVARTTAPRRRRR